MNSIQARLESLSPEQREMLLNKIRCRKQQKDQENKIEISPLIHVPRQEQMQLSLAQERMWFIEQLDETHNAYAVATAGYLSGELDKRYLQQALNKVVERHEILRTTFVNNKGKPYQRISQNSAANWHYKDIRSCDESKKQTEIEAFITTYTAEPFNLEHGPLHRIGLIQLEDRRYLLLLVMHHIITDGWSLGIFFCDLAHYYNQLTGTKQKSLPALDIQYADYAAWQQSLARSGAFQKDIEYWKQRLADAPPLLALPLDRPRPATEKWQGATGSFFIPPALTGRLKEIGQSTEVSLFMITLAGFAAVLNRYTRQDDIIIGTPVANRKELELEPLIGLFVNSIALRIRFEDHFNVFSFLKQVRSVVLEAFSHADAPFEQVVDACVKERNLAHSPLFQVMFAFQNAPLPETFLGDCFYSPIAIERNTTHFDLGFFLSEKDGGLEVTYEYRADIFDKETIHRFGNHYLRVLQGLVDFPSLPVKNLRLLTEEERSALTCEKKNEKQKANADSSVVSLFEDQCKRAGDTIAVSGTGGSISYRKLNIRANRLARVLREQGVEADTVVALALDRSIDMIVAVVAIMKAGGACLPVDLSNPPERRSEIITGSGVEILLTSTQIAREYHFTRSVTGDSGLKIISIDTMAENSGDEDNPNYTFSLDDLAYVLYTSGSTGKPKGVAMPHRSLSNLVAWQLSQAGFADRANTLQFSPLCFDVSFQEIFCTLCSGGTLILIDDFVRRDSGALLDILERFEVERLFMPFVALQQLANTSVKVQRYPQSLRELITAGEQLRITEPVRMFFEQLPGCRLHNQYGPTESHVVTSLTLPEDVSTWPILPSIGRPIENCAIYILEKNLEPAPVGVPGELYISGRVCARGYLNQPAMTAERFINDPFSNTSQARMYRSGDLARYLPDGTIEYLGRVDHQVKIRGFRVELQEIESVLDCLPQVKECAVIVDEKNADQPELAAYIVGNEECDISAVREELAAKLPFYMVPRYLLQIEAMPLTPNGKIDRQALVELDRKNCTRENIDYTGRPTELLLCEVWARVLELPSVQVHDNFFESGGHSLLATQLISEINELFSLALPIREIFEYPTVAELADRIESTSDQEQDRFLESDNLATIDPSILSFAQERLWLVEQTLGESAVYNMPVALECEGALDLAALEEAIRCVVQRHETLRTTFIKDGAGKPQKKVHDTIGFSLVRHNLPVDITEEGSRKYIERFVHQEANTPFDLERGPLIRSGILKLAPERHVLLLTFHHIICDGWSIGLFSKELSIFYKALTSGDKPEIGQLKFQYHHFAHWQRKLLDGQRGIQLRNYWQEQLAGVPHLLDLAMDSTVDARHGSDGKLVSFAFDQKVCRGLHDLSRAQASTLFMTLLSAFSWLIFLLSGQERFLIGTPIANRNRKPFESLIGFFVNILPIRVDFGGDPDFTDIIRQMRGTCLDAYANQDMPFDEIVRLLRPDRVPNRHPLVQVVFVLQNTPEPRLTLGDTRLTPISRDQTVAKYDLLMSLTQNSGEIHGALEYSTDLFTDESAQNIVDVYTRIISTVLSNPSIRVLDPDIFHHSSPEKQSDVVGDDIHFDF